MLGLVSRLAADSLFCVMTVLVVAVAAYWVRYHTRVGRSRRQYYRERERLRREYWGWD